MPAKSSIVHSTVVRLHADGEASTIADPVSVEEPLEIRIGKKPFVVTMRTPGNDEELAAGFLFTEGIVQSKGQIKELSRCASAPTPENTIQARLSTECSVDDATARHGAISASCGICGKTSIESIKLAYPFMKSSRSIARNTLLQLPTLLREHQADFEATGGLHAAGLFDFDGKLICLREDIGRHNAVDKVIGHSIQGGLGPQVDKVLVVSGRVSFEIVQKALAARIGLVAAVSAPSSLAISCARECGQTLVGFLRHPQMNVYSHPQRISD